MSLDYTIVVPSRKRVHNMGVIRSLLPTALICVDEGERAAYRTVVPDEKLLVHPPMQGLASVINWMMEVVRSKILIEVDDDFTRIMMLVGSKRKITNPAEILAIIENAARNCQDLGLTTFCFSRTANTAMVHPEEVPIRPTQPVCNAFGIMGAARYRHYDPSLLGRADMDWALRTLLEDRIVYADTRFYFDCGKVFAGRGGNVGVVTSDQFKHATRAIIKKWGKNVSYTPLAFQKTRSVAPLSIRVARRTRQQTNETATHELAAEQRLDLAR